MEYKRRSLSSSLENDVIESDNFKETSYTKRRGSSMSLDEEMEEYTEFMYNGAFNICNFFARGIKNLICFCFRK